MNQLQIFNNPTFGKVRTLKDQDGKVLFCGNDVATALGYKNPSKALADHCKGIVERRTNDSLGRRQQMNFIPEGDIYRLAAKSELPGADAFERWIFDEVLPSIRKTGSYSAHDELEAERIAAQRERAKAMLLNAQTRLYSTIMKTIDNKKLSPIAAEVFGIGALEEVTGKAIGYRPECERTYSATEVGQMLGVSSQRIGKTANANGLKTDEYGVTVMDKSPYSAKEIPSFRYNERAVKKLGELLRKGSA